MADEQIRIDVTATDDASKVLEDVADDAEKLEKLSPEIAVTADTDQAERGIKDVADDVDALSRKDTEILLRAKIDDARGALKKLRGDLDQTGEKADTTARQLDRIGGDGGGGMRTRGNAIADLTGPLGDASGAASDFAGVFDGLGDIAEDVAGKVGVSAATMSTAIGGIGIAVAAAAAVWTLYKQRQEQAKEQQRALRDGQREINDAIRDGDYAAAASKFNELYGPETIRYAELLGVSIRQMTDYVTGNSDAVQENIDKLAAQGGNSEMVAGFIENLRTQYEEANGSIKEQDQVLDALTGSFRESNRQVDAATKAQERLERQTDQTKAGFDRIRGSLNMESAFLRFNELMDDAARNAHKGADLTAEEILDIKNAILDVAEFAKLTPVEVRSLLQRVDEGDFMGVRADIERHYRQAPVKVFTELQPPAQHAIASFVGAVQGAVGTVTVPVRGVFAGVSGSFYNGPRDP